MINSSLRFASSYLSLTISTRERERSLDYFDTMTFKQFAVKSKTQRNWTVISSSSRLIRIKYFEGVKKLGSGILRKGEKEKQMNGINKLVYPCNLSTLWGLLGNSKSNKICFVPNKLGLSDE